MSILKRGLAPFGDNVWEALEDEAKKVFSRRLTSRKIADYEGAKGLEFAAVGTGRATELKEKLGGVSIGAREVLKALELKTSFTLKREDIDLIERGAKAFDNSAIAEAARAFSDAENAIVFDGFKKEGIAGILPSLTQKPVKAQGDDILPAVAEAIRALRDEGVEGPYALVVQQQYYGKLFSIGDGYPLTKRLSELLDGGKALGSTAIKSGALVISLRGGDYEILGGVDISLGFEKENAQGAELFFFETLSFRVNTPEAAVALQWQ
ncbi:MAG: bacteriocin family protein [Helicobacteraceae bacterium]|jgi:uncharacterized linocin/CFP29 family protein|nr:bacteriocin family protein [Helicobacteraceae bacterium]